MRPVLVPQLDARGRGGDRGGRQGARHDPGREPEKGRLDLPGGFLEVGEHPADGLVREIQEELGWRPRSSATRCSRRRTPTGRVGTGCSRSASASGSPAGDPARRRRGRVRWVSLEEIDDLDFAWAHDRELVRAALERENG
ncbi:NUDIX domain-containing protein [Rubrobacter marinus]|uniref:NUDIX domain-containing protein n=1 Tax=Rubrobacter marinus TaxID=2653852 RepID=A0A6G8Q1X9_9ACTN|nr:NUDIX domain-containing protein [Rubrobacter marinus]QIN80494.1 NUDIX domain-containing protein [Rubrobacter marinus]